eukprot:359999-Prymnesium_polylepis.1
MSGAAILMCVLISIVDGRRGGTLNQRAPVEASSPRNAQMPNEVVIRVHELARREYRESELVPCTNFQPSFRAAIWRVTLKAKMLLINAMPPNAKDGSTVLSYVVPGWFVLWCDKLLRS